MVRKTKRVSKASTPVSRSAKVKPITVPELRRAFEHIHTFLHKGATAQAFRKEWKKVFGTELSEKAAADYLAFVESDKGKKQNHKQRGGGQMSPAALGYDMTNPGTAPQTPSVPAYVAGGMVPPVDSVYATCGQNKFLPPAVGMGSATLKGGRRTRKKQGGGALSLSSAFAEFAQRPFAMGSPPGMGNDATMLSKGYNSLSSPRPEINNPFLPQVPGVYTASISPASRLF
jgi:hypothetical protein